MADYIPQNDAEFNVWQAGLVEITESKLIDWGIPGRLIFFLLNRTRIKNNNIALIICFCGCS